MTAERLALLLGAHRIGSGWMGKCPAHDDSTPSLSINQSHIGKLLVRCHAGCEQTEVIAALRNLGLWGQAGTADLIDRVDTVPVGPADRDTEKARTARALQLWCKAQQAEGSLVEEYLRSRNILVKLPKTIKFHAYLKHASGCYWPAMIGLVTRGRDDRPIGIHRTFLLRDGLGKAPVKPNKMMLGPCRGGAIRLAAVADPLMIGEGIETCLAAMQATGYAAWAALSTNGLRALVLPTNAGDIIVLADGDEAGEAAAIAAASRWREQGRRVRIARSPLGTDFNDLLGTRNASGREPLRDER